MVRNAKLELQPKSHPKSGSEDRDDGSIELAIRAVLGGELGPKIRPEGHAKAKAENPSRTLTRFIGRLRRAVAGVPRPRRRQVAIVAVALAILLWPLQILAFMLLTVITLLVCYWTLGHERAVELTAQTMEWLEARSPAVASRLRQGAQRFGKAVFALVARLPERWTEGLYLPDFEPHSEPPEKMRVDPFERLVEDRKKRLK